MISLNVQQLNKSFGNNRVLQDITFRHEGGVLGIAGPNGSGKSTLLQCLAGLLRPSSGTVKWTEDGRLLDDQALKSKLGYAAPYISLYRELTVSENISFLAQLRKTELEDDRLERLMSKVKLDHLHEKPFRNLSTGQQQRARLVSALFTDPDILILDEPGSNLDDDGREVVHELVAKANSRQKTVILASNRREELSLCDRVYSVRNGHRE